MNPLMAYMSQQNMNPRGNRQNLWDSFAQNSSNPLTKYLTLNSLAEQQNGNVQTPTQSSTSTPQDAIPQQTPMNNSPLVNGSQSAMQTAKQSLQLDDSQRDRAMGASLVNFFANMAKPHDGGEGFSGTLSATAQSMGPAFEAYQKEESNQQNLNNHLMQQVQRQQQYEAQLAQKMKMHQESLDEKKLKREDENARKKEELDWKKIYNTEKIAALKAKGSQLSKEERQNLKTESKRLAALENGETWLGSLPDKGKAFSLFVDEEQKKIPKMYETQETLDKMGAIIEKYPDLGSSFYHILAQTPSDKKEGQPWWKLGAKKITDKNQLAAIEHFNKLNSQLNLETIFSVPSAKQATDVLKTMIDTSNANSTMTKKGFDSVKNDLVTLTNNRIKQSNYLREGRDRGVMPKTVSKEQYLGKNTPNQNDSGQKLKLIEEQLAARGIQ